MSDARRVGDAQVRKLSMLVSAGAMEGIGSAIALKSIADELMALRAENAALRALVADVAESTPTTFYGDGQTGTLRCAYCGDYAYRDPVRHDPSCLRRRAVELTQGDAKEHEGGDRLTRN